MPKQKGCTQKKVKHPRDVEADRKIELEKKKLWYCFRCGAGIPSKIKRKKNKVGEIEGKCPSCKRRSVFVDYYPTVENVEKQEEQGKAKLKKVTEEGLKQEEQGIKDFQDPDLLLNIKEELDKDHVGDDKAKLFLFACACSSRLRPENRFSSAVTGDKSEGKDNLWKTIHRHLPEGWFLDLTRVTTASMEDDIKEYNGLYIGEGNFEGGINAPIRDTLKQLVEDGISVLKKDKREDQKKSRHEEQPRKVGIYSTTKHSEDPELSSRFCVVSVHGSPSKYKRVTEYIKTIAGNIDLQIDQSERKDKPTWIRNGLVILKSFDFIDIPFAPLLEVEYRDSRSQRDFKRFLDLIRSLAWICQHNRVCFKHRGYRVLVASAEDFYNAMEIGKEIFDQSLSGFEPRLKKVVGSLQKIMKEKSGAIVMGLEGADPDLSWVDRRLVQEDLGIKTRDTMNKRVKQLSDMGVLAWFNKGSRSYIAFKFTGSPSNLPSNYPLITVDKNKFYELINNNYDNILKELSTVIDGKSTVKSTFASPDKKIKSNILSLTKKRPSTSTKNEGKEQELAIITSLKSKIDAKISTVKIDNEDLQHSLDQLTLGNKKELIENSEDIQGIDLSKYEMTVRRVEEILGSEKLPALQIARRMKKTSIKDMGFIEDILKQSVNDPSFETTLKVDPEGNYFNKNMEESNGK